MTSRRRRAPRPDRARRPGSRGAAGRTCTTSRSTGRCAASAFFADGVERAAAGRRHGRARDAPERRPRSSPARTARCRQRAAVPGRRTRSSIAARSASTSSARRATTRPAAARGMVVQRGYRQPPSFHIDRLRQRRAGLLLRRDDQRLRRDARLPGADHAARPLGHRRLHPRAAARAARGGEHGHARRESRRSVAEAAPAAPRQALRSDGETQQKSSTRPRSAGSSSAA